jgi:hypothetical protein
LDSAPDPADIALREAPLGSAARDSAAVPAATPASDAQQSPARVALRLLARGGGIIAGVSVLAMPLWIVAGVEYRPVILRLGAAAVLGIAAVRILGDARRRVAQQAPSALDRAARPAPAEASIPREYRDVAEELHFGRSSNGYWARVLEPRLAALAARLPGAQPVETPPRSAPRRLLGLGPSLGVLRGAIERLERRR